MKKHDYDAHRSKAGKIWHFLWHEDSWLSFLVDIILILIIGNFILFPGLGAIMGTEFPVVAVISGSMDHHGLGFDEWWNQNKDWYDRNNISKNEFDSFYLNNGFKKGDVLVISGRSISELNVGDTIVYSVSGRRDPIIHRVIRISEDGKSVATKGDANSGQLSFENSIEEEQIHGEAVLLIPKIGWVKVIFVELLNAF